MYPTGQNHEVLDQILSTPFGEGSGQPRKRRPVSPYPTYQSTDSLPQPDLSNRTCTRVSTGLRRAVSWVQERIPNESLIGLKGLANAAQMGSDLGAWIGSRSSSIVDWIFGIIAGGELEKNFEKDDGASDVLNKAARDNSVRVFVTHVFRIPIVGLIKLIEFIPKKILQIGLFLGGGAIGLGLNAVAYVVGGVSLPLAAATLWANNKIRNRPPSSILEVAPWKQLFGSNEAALDVL